MFNNEKRTKGSGYRLDKILSMNVDVYPYIEKNIGSYIELEKKLTCINNI